MENKGLLKLPETWFVRVTDENKDVLSQWSFDSDSTLHDGFITGMYKWESGNITKEWAVWGEDDTNCFGQEITFADFKRLVLGENNSDDYGVLGCEELAMYFEYNNIEDLEGRIKENIYFLLSRWDYEDFENSKRQSLPLTEYLKLIEPETMEKKYEYRLRDKKYLEVVRCLGLSQPYNAENISQGSWWERNLNELNVLDLFFEKIEVKELPIIGGSKPIISEDGDLIEIAGFQMDMYIIDHFKSFTLGNDIHVSESDIKQIREYLRK